MGKRVQILLFTLLALIMNSCGSKDEGTPEWQWGDSDSTSSTVKPRYIWIDAAANFPDYADSKDNILRDLTLVKNNGFTDIVVDVRPTTGDVLFTTDAVNQVTKLDYWTDSGQYKFYERTATWDYLQAFIDIGHGLGLKVHAAINTFVGGNRYLYGLGDPQGLLYRDSSKRSWATSLSLTSGISNIMDVSDDNYATKFLNPGNEDVQSFLLTLIGDLAKYDVDGIFLDRCRFDDLSSDFSDDTKQKFQKYIGATVSHFPDDVVVPGTTAGDLPSTLPTYFKKWLEFRAKTIHDFVVKARSKVKSVNANIQFGVYVGAWYSTYYDSGVNWASPKYDPSSTYSWASVDYKTYGYADHLDYLLLGAYASADKVYGTGEWTMQGFCKNTKTLLAGDVEFAGGPDVGNWTIPTGTNVGSAITNSVDACINASNGYFVFDISHVKKYGYWSYLKTGIDTYLSSIASN